jgi:hypothetical protein
LDLLILAQKKDPSRWDCPPGAVAAVQVANAEEPWCRIGHDLVDQTLSILGLILIHTLMKQND